MCSLFTDFSARSQRMISAAAQHRRLSLAKRPTLSLTGKFFCADFCALKLDSNTNGGNGIANGAPALRGLSNWYHEWRLSACRHHFAVRLLHSTKWQVKEKGSLCHMCHHIVGFNVNPCIQIWSKQQQLQQFLHGSAR